MNLANARRLEQGSEEAQFNVTGNLTGQQDEL